MEYCDSKKYFKEYDFIIEDKELKEYQEQRKFKDLNIINYDEQELKNKLFCFHPHGIFCYGAGISTLDSRNKVIYQCAGVASRMTTMVPLSGLIHTLHGNFGANQNQFLQLMKQGISFILYPGGFEEAALTQYQKHRVFIKERKGFIKYAIQNNYSIYPCYQFGETSLYYTIQNDFIGSIMSRLKLVSILPYSKFFWFPLNNVKMILVIGNSISYQNIVQDYKNPSKTEIETVHKLYIQQLQKIYNQYKNQYANGQDLEIK